MGSPIAGWPAWQTLRRTRKYERARRIRPLLHLHRGLDHRLSHRQSALRRHLSKPRAAALFDRPFVGALTGTQYVQQFPVNVPPHNVSSSNPFVTDWSRYEPINGAISFFYKNRTPYAMNFHFTVERQVGRDTVASVSYIGTLGRHLLTSVGANPGVPSLCLGLSQAQDVAPGTPTCGPFGENGVYVRPNGSVVAGTRAPFDNRIGSDGYFAAMGNSNYNGLEIIVKRTTGPLTLLAGYTFSKSLDWLSNLQEQVNPYDNAKNTAPPPSISGTISWRATTTICRSKNSPGGRAHSRPDGPFPASRGLPPVFP